MDFIHLHVHTNFSFGDGACRIDELVAAAAGAGMPAVAVTDHDGLYGAVRFYQACQKAGLKPIVGVEINVEGSYSSDRDARRGGRARGADDPSAGSAGARGGTAAAPLTVGEALELAKHAWSRRAAAERRADDEWMAGGGRAGADSGGWPGASSADGRTDAWRRDGRTDAWGGAARAAAADTSDERGAYDGPLRGQTMAPGYHIVLLAQNYEGWSNLCRIISAAHLEHPGEPPLVRWPTLAEHGAHLICLSGCRRGELGQAVLAALRGERGARERARRVAARYAELFAPAGAGRAGGRGSAADPAAARYFIELQHELLPDSPDYIRELTLVARELGLPVVATNNVHYLTQAEAPLHDVLAAEAANQPLPNPLGRRNAELSFKSAAQMRRLFFHLPQAVANSAVIAQRCTLDLGLGRLLFPAYPLPPGETAYSLLCKRCFAGAAERYQPVTPEVTRRLEHELKVIGELGFAEYFLAVADIVTFARSHDIPYSGRGSAGNSIVSYVLRVCDADPIAHDLLFERFLNPFRREMPDVDIDFCSERRDEVIAFIYERFGHDKVAMVATVNTMHAPSAVRVVAKAFDYRPDEVNRLSRKIPWGGADKLSAMLAERPELADHDFQQPHFGRLVHLAEQLAGFPAHLGTHLGGFILAREPLTDRIPLQWAAKGVIVAQFDKDDVETLGLVKMDILGLRMHSAIAEAVRRVRTRTGVEISPWELPRDDPEVYRLIAGAHTLGMFQLESAGQRNLATRLREKTFEDVIAAISLFRPGPLQAEMIGPFIRRRHGHERAAVPHPAMVPALEGTYGVILYQEQVISVASAVAGFSLWEADMLRRAMTHDRSLEEMDQIGVRFVEKAVANGVDRATAEEVFRQLRGFAAYGFNKAHAACFAVVCNASAWLKAHYPAEFYCGLLNNQPMGFYSPRVVLNDARRWGLGVLPVDINRSEEGFCVEATGDGRADSAAGAAQPPAPSGGSSDPPLALRVGLRYVKTMSTDAMRRIVAERGDVPRDRVGRPLGRDGRRLSEPGEAAAESTTVGGAAGDGPPRPYTSLADFVERTRTSIEITQNLARVGAFDAFGTRREELLAQLPILYAGLARHGRGGSGRGRRDGAAGGRMRREGAATIGPRTGGAAGGSRPTEAWTRPTGEAPGAAGEALRLALPGDLPPLDFLPSWTLQEKVRAELDVLGLNVSAHPLSFLRAELRALQVTPFNRLAEVPHGRRVRLAGVLERAQMPWIRSGHRTLFLTLEDETELAQIVVFNDTYLKFGRILKDALYLYVEGVLQNDDEHGLAVVAHRFVDLMELVRPGGGRASTAGGGGRHAPSPAASRPPAPAAAGTPLGGPGNRYPFTGPAPEDTRPAGPARRLTLPDVQPRTRPGRTG